MPGRVYPCITTRIRNKSEVNLITGCVVFTGHKIKGYGVIKYQGKNQYVHRVIWYLQHKEWVKEIDHKCRNKACINIKHLRPVTHSENMLNVEKKTKCKRGHEFTSHNGRQNICLICRNLKQQQRRSL